MEKYGSSLNTKTIFSLLIPLLLYALATAVFQDAIISPSFTDLEYREAKKDAQRCVSAINREIHHLQAVTNDWASFNDTYEFIEDRNDQYIEDNLLDSTFINLNLNFIYFLDTDGEIVWGKAAEYDGGIEYELDIFKDSGIGTLHDLGLKSGDDGEIPPGRGGVLPTAYGPLVVSSEPILTSQCRGPLRGTLIFGRLLSTENLNLLSTQTRIPFSVISTAEVADGSPRLRYIYKKMNLNDDWFLEIKSRNKLAFYTIFRDLGGSPAFIITAELPREIVAKGKASLLYAWISTFLAWTIITVFLLLLIRKNVLIPINRMTSHILRLEKTGDLSQQMSIDTNDEIGILMNEFNRLLDKVDENNVELHQMNEELLRMNRLKDLLVSVLSHDLRTPFSTLSAASYLIDESIADGDFEEIRSVNELMKRNIGEGEQLLSNLLEWIRVQMDPCAEPVICRLEVSELIRQSAAGLLDRASVKNIRLIFPSESVPILAERTSAEACIRNILSNAVKFTGPGGKIIVDCSRESCIIDSHGEDRLLSRISIRDDGVGMDNDQLEKINNDSSRYSSAGTAGEIGSGMGLIISRELMRMNGGSIEISSRPDEGTEVVLYFPAAVKADASNDNRKELADESLVTATADTDH